MKFGEGVDLTHTTLSFRKNPHVRSYPASSEKVALLVIKPGN